MSDYISRQAAIDAICKACSMEEDYHKCDGYPEGSTWCDELVALRALPSEEPEIIRCKDCKWSEPVSGYLLCGAWEAKAVDKDGFCSDAERRTND